MKKLLLSVLLVLGFVSLHAEEKPFQFKTTLEKENMIVKSGSDIVFQIDQKAPEDYRFTAWNVHAYTKNVPAEFPTLLNLKVTGTDPQWKCISFHSYTWIPKTETVTSGSFSTKGWPAGDYCLTVTGLFRQKEKPNLKTDKYLSSELVFSIEK